MNMLDKIKKRIATMAIAKNQHIKEVEITKEEARQIPPSIKYINGAKLIIVEKLGDRTKKDCFAYEETECYGLNELYCKHEECRFYRNDIKKSRLETEIKKYSLRWRRDEQHENVL